MINIYLPDLGPKHSSSRLAQTVGTSNAELLSGVRRGLCLRTHTHSCMHRAPCLGRCRLIGVNGHVWKENETKFLPFSNSSGSDLNPWVAASPGKEGGSVLVPICYSKR